MEDTEINESFQTLEQLKAKPKEELTRSDMARLIAQKGGETTKRRYGPEYYSRIAKMKRKKRRRYMLPRVD